MNDVVIQHHDTIVTSSDLGLAVACQYDLTNKTVANEVDLGIQGDVKTGLSEEVIVDSPNVAMRITDRSGDDTIASAEVGDPLVIILPSHFSVEIDDMLLVFLLTHGYFLGTPIRDLGPELAFRNICARTCCYGWRRFQRNYSHR